MVEVQAVEVEDRSTGQSIQMKEMSIGRWVAGEGRLVEEVVAG